MHMIPHVGTNLIEKELPRLFRSEPQCWEKLNALLAVHLPHILWLSNTTLQTRRLKDLYLPQKNNSFVVNMGRSPLHFLLDHVERGFQSKSTKKTRLGGLSLPVLAIAGTGYACYQLWVNLTRQKQGGEEISKIDSRAISEACARINGIFEALAPIIRTIDGMEGQNRFYPRFLKLKKVFMARLLTCNFIRGIV